MADTVVISKKLAACLIDFVGYPPKKKGMVYAAKVPWSLVEEARALVAEEFPGVDLDEIHDYWVTRETNAREAQRAARIARQEGAQ